MSFQTGLSGLNASSQRLDVIGNNIANANTVAMKSSRTEFAEIVAQALGPSGGGSVGGGIGVAVGAVTQQFSQGTINITGNALDVAINGGGFFQILLRDGTTAFTRDGQFKLTSDGEIVTNSGAQVMGYPTTLEGVATSATVEPMIVPTGAPIPARATGTVSAEFNLDARAVVGATAIPPVAIGTYGTTLTGYDSQGMTVPITLYFDKTGPDAWDVYVPDPASTDAAPLPPTLLTSMTFDTNGALTSPVGTVTMTLQSDNPTIGQFPVDLDLSGATQYGAAFAVSALSQDGYAPGNLTGVSINENGVLLTTYSNGQSQARGQISLSDFRNVQGLRPVGSGSWVETVASGQPIQGQPGVGNFGKLRAGATEDSNVDLTAELINMMTAQRDYQANAQTIKTQDQILSTLVNMR